MLARLVSGAQAAPGAEAGGHPHLAAAPLILDIVITRLAAAPLILVTTTIAPLHRAPLTLDITIIAHHLVLLILVTTIIAQAHRLVLLTPDTTIIAQARHLVLIHIITAQAALPALILTTIRAAAAAIVTVVDIEHSE